MSRLQAAVFQVLEGFTLSDDVRKILEAAYYADDTFAQGRAAGLEEERKAFEEWFNQDRAGLPLSSTTAAITWRTWQARAALSSSSDAGKDDARDTVRLDFMIDRGAFVHPTKTDAGTMAYQVMQQDEDEDYHILSGEDRFFPTYRAAIDAALSSLEVIGKGKK